MMKPAFAQPLRRRDIRAFSLLEMLAASAVLSVLMVLLIQVLGTLSTTSSSSQRRSEMMKQAIGAFERVHFDLKERIQTGGTSILVVKGDSASVNDTLWFIAPVSASVNHTPNEPRKLSLIRYGIQPRPSGQPGFDGWPDMSVFSRSVVPFAWGNNIGNFLPLTSSQVSSAVGDAETQSVSPSIIRFEICFQKWDGTVVDNPPDDFSAVRALIFGMVSVDKNAVGRLTSSERAALAAKFPKPSNNQRPASAWNSVVASLPSNLKATLRIYEQTISF